MSLIVRPFHRSHFNSFLLIFPCILLTFAVPVPAQSAPKIEASLDAGSRAVVDRLGELHEIPDGVWKTHSGDLAHGEAAGLDESAWQEIKRGGKAPNEAVWFRQTYQVPQTLNGYDLTGARIWFQFHAYANGPMPEILYFNGRRVAMGDDLEPIVLFDQARARRQGDGGGEAAAHGGHEELSRRDAEDRFPGEPAESGGSARGVSVGGAAGSVAGAGRCRRRLATLNEAIRAVDLAALDAHDQAKFDASLKAAQASWKR